MQAEINENDYKLHYLSIQITFDSNKCTSLEKGEGFDVYIIKIFKGFAYKSQHCHLQSSNHLLLMKWWRPLTQQQWPSFVHQERTKPASGLSLLEWVDYLLGRSGKIPFLRTEFLCALKGLIGGREIGVVSNPPPSTPRPTPQKLTSLPTLPPSRKSQFDILCAPPPYQKLLSRL